MTQHKDVYTHKTEGSKKEKWQKSSVSKDRKYHNIGGKPMYETRFDEVMSFHDPGLAPVKTGNEWFHIWPNGERAYQHSFDRAWGFYSGLAAVNLKGESFHIGIDGTPAYKKRYAWVGNFQQNLCAVKFKSGRYGHIQKDGYLAHQETYCYAGDYRENSAVVQLDNGKHIHIDPTGLPLNDEQFLDLGPFHKGIAPARDERGWFHINVLGKQLYERRFLTVEPFYNGIARVQSFSGGIETIDEQSRTLSILREETTTPLQRVSEIMVSYWKSNTLHTAIELGVFDKLPLSTEMLSEALCLAYRNTERLMRALWELDMVYPEDSVWHVTETGYILVPSSKQEMSAVDFNWSHFGRISWDKLTESLVTGVPGWEITKGEPFFKALTRDDKEFDFYNRAMKVYADQDYDEVHELINTTDVTNVADVGCGYSELLYSILRLDTKLSGVLFDKPETISRLKVPPIFQGRVKKIGGDIFGEWGFTADIVMLTRVLHDWDDDFARMILEKAKLALNGNGTILIIEMVLTDHNPSGSLADLNLLTTCGGRERSLNDWNSLFSSASLEIFSMTKLKRYGYLMELQIR